MSGRTGVAGVAGAAAEATTHGLAVLTEHHRVVWVNRALLRILGVEPALGPGPNIRLGDVAGLDFELGAGAGLDFGLGPGAGPDLELGAGAGPGLGSSARAGDLAAAAGRAALATSGLALPDLEPDGPVRTLPWTSTRGVRQLEASCRRLRGGERRRPWSLLLYEITDVTASRERESRASRREQGLARMVAIARTGSWDWNLLTGELRCSDTLVTLLGFPAGTEIDVSTYRGFVHPDDLGTVMSTVQVALADRGPFTCVHRLVLPDGLPDYVVELHGEVAADGQGRPVRVSGIARDVTGEQRAQRELRHLVDHDPLTGLRNRRAVVAHLTTTCAGPEPRPGALLLIGLDHFKDPNDLRGPVVGDQVLRSVANLLIEQVPDAVVGRLGGDEFAVVLPIGGARAALARARALCAAIARRPVVADGVALRTAARIGVAPRAGASGGGALVSRGGLA
ncbi:MAG: sensor domain-containing diguanylate cyclase, partial [Frankia sp.]